MRWTPVIRPVKIGDGSQQRRFRFLHGAVSIVAGGMKAQARAKATNSDAAMFEIGFDEGPGEAMTHAEQPLRGARFI